MEMNMGKFSEKLVELLELAKKKKNVLEYQEINDFFKDQPLGVEQMEKVFDWMVPLWSQDGSPAQMREAFPGQSWMLLPENMISAWQHLLRSIRRRYRTF